MLRSLIVIVGLGLSVSSASGQTSPLVGKPAPPVDFGKFTPLQGEPTSLAKLRGKVVLVNYWAIWCPHCQASLPTLRRIVTRYEDKGLVTLSLTGYYRNHQFDLRTAKVVRPKKPLSAEQEQETLKQYLKFRRLPQTSFVLDAKQANDFSRRYAVKTLPYFMLIDKKGDVRLVLHGYGDKTGPELERWLKFLLEK